MSTSWISTAERMPEDGQSVAFVVSLADGSTHDYLNGRVLGGTYHAGKYGGFSIPGITFNASHWMPLLDPPK